MKMFWTNLLLGIRILLFSVVVLAGVVFILANAKDALAASLRDVSVVTENTLKLGDVFDGLTQNADYVLGPAPQPGKEMVLNAKTLYRIALAMDLSWRPAHSAQQVVIRRTATVIPSDVVEERIIERLNEEGLEANFDLSLYSDLQDIILPLGEIASIEFESFSFDAQGDYFDAVVVAPSRANPISKIPVSGRIQRLIDIPVLKTSLRNGDIIGETDIDWIEVPARKTQRDVVFKSDDLIGMTPRRTVFAGKPMLTGDLERPQIVKRGEMITLIYVDGPMRLSTKGKALQNGAKGDVIRISNVKSHKTIEGLVTNQREVTVQ